MTTDSKLHFQESHALLRKVLAAPDFLGSVDKAIALLSETLKNGNKIIACGNGGSMSDAMHFAEELSGRFRDNRKSLASIAISDPGYISCVANDFGYSEVFSRFVEGLGNTGDTLLAISTSGKSENVVKAARTALAKGIQVVALTGNSGGDLGSLASVEIRVPFEGYADHIQEIHILAIHAMIKGIEQKVL